MKCNIDSFVVVLPELLGRLKFVPYTFIIAQNPSQL